MKSYLGRAKDYLMKKLGLYKPKPKPSPSIFSSPNGYPYMKGKQWYWKYPDGREVPFLTDGNKDE